MSATRMKPKRTVEVSVRINQFVDVDIDLSDISTDDLLNELASRDSLPTTVTAERAYFALPKDAPEPVRAFIAEQAGRIW